MSPTCSRSLIWCADAFMRSLNLGTENGGEIFADEYRLQLTATRIAMVLPVPSPSIEWQAGWRYKHS